MDAKSSTLQYIPTTTKELNEAEQDDVLKCVEAIEEADDVQNGYHNLKRRQAEYLRFYAWRVYSCLTNILFQLHN